VVLSAKCRAQGHQGGRSSGPSGARRRRWNLLNEIIAAHPLDEVGRLPDFGSAAATLRWMLIHIVEERPSTPGHLDAIRELLDGQERYY